ncbi:HPr kinase/phosphorylase [Sphingomonas flavalba]|uniref:HPr kinase/phosphorylase n=1 Tax=Sphingomonas flavalba TaxID=2559804 RepID=UPI0039DF9529
MTTLSTEMVHATAVSIHGRGVLIEGRSGSGKSDLALRLIDRGALLVSDDQVLLTREGARLIATAPATIAGKIEVRGLGILDHYHRERVEIGLIVRLDDAVERMPDAPEAHSIAGVAVPVVTVLPFEASAPIKVELALRIHGLPA